MPVKVKKKDAMELFGCKKDFGSFMPRNLIKWIFNLLEIFVEEINSDRRECDVRKRFEQGLRSSCDAIDFS